MLNKKSKRKKLNQKRNSLNSDQVNEFSLQICLRILDSEVFKSSQCVALYSAFKNEADLSVLLNSKKKLCLPVVLNNNAMVFHYCDVNTSFSKNKYGILEPQNDKIVNTNEIDLCLLPLVGFNRVGHRLGMGGGYYDRYFEHNKSQEKPTILVGVAYDFQEDDTIKSESWDVPLDLIFTNKEVINSGE
ncbi:MAG: 5-formyltetrahydrofolate cyclo-ligase [Marinicellaceae bacterium]